MKRLDLFCILCIMSLFVFSQENQTTYSNESNKNSKGAIENTTFDGMQQSKSEVNYPNSTTTTKAIEHRSKAIWADNSTIVSDEKTGYHSYIPYPYVGEDDILWAKRIRRWVDIRIVQNHPLYFPVEIGYQHYQGWAGPGIRKNSGGASKTFNEVLSGIDARKNLFQILRDAATTINPETGMPIVSTYNMSLTRKLSSQEVIPDWDEGYPNAFGFRVDDKSFLNDPEGEDTTAIYWYSPADVLGYWIEEEVFFDKRRAKLDFRFISITPRVLNPNDKPVGSSRDLPTFYFPEIRELLANHKVFPLDGNLAQRMSFDEFFHRKFFASNVVKETNIYDRELQDYLPGRTLDQLLEGQKIKEQIRLYETDMWNY